MFSLKKYYFNKKVYPIFFENIVIAQKNESGVIFIEVIDEVLTILIIVNKKALLCDKRIDSPLLIREFTFTPTMEDLPEELYSIIKKTKNRATTVKNHHFIENFAELLNQVKIQYKLTLEQQHNIWKSIFGLDRKFFREELKIILPEGVEHKWVD